VRSAKEVISKEEDRFQGRSWILSRQSRNGIYTAEQVFRMANLEVIGPGFGRTGTMSLFTALNQLGYKTHHMTEAFKTGLAGWAKAGRGEKVDFSELLKGYNATTDFPSCMYYKELIKLNPKAKVILSYRDPNKWYDSATESIMRISVFLAKEAYVLPYLIPWVKHMDDVWVKPMFGTVDRFKDRKFCIDLYNRHVEEVKRVIPADQLLVFEVSQGWEPLCKFLGKPIPSTPFPHVNDAAKWRRMLKTMYWVDVLLRGVVLSTAVGIGYWLSKHYTR